MDKFKILPAYILVFMVCLGNILSLFPGYDYLVKNAAGGACIPILGFGYSLGKSVIEKVNEIGLMGVITGGLSGVSAGITFAILISFLFSFIFTSKTKSLKWFVYSWKIFQGYLFNEYICVYCEINLKK